MKTLFRAESIFQEFEIETEYIKKINGKWNIIGFEMFNEKNNRYYISTYDDLVPVECKKDTRSINFEDMLDSEGNKIFASLSEDGKGGDIFESAYTKSVCVYKYMKMWAYDIEELGNQHQLDWMNVEHKSGKVIGIKQ